MECLNKIYFGADLHISSDPRNINTEIRILKKFCDTYGTTKEDILILLGDTGINTNSYIRDHMVKTALAELPVTLVMLYGNHEVRPEDVPKKLAHYERKIWHGGNVYVEDRFPTLIFLIDGEIYDLNGKRAIAIGGAHSIDKWIRRNRGMLWVENEQPSEEIKQKVEEQLEKATWKIDYVLSHTVPKKYIPEEALLPEHPSYDYDESTEEWLDSIRKKLKYEAWMCGHFHIDKDIENVHFLFGRFFKLP